MAHASFTAGVILPDRNTAAIRNNRIRQQNSGTYGSHAQRARQSVIDQMQRKHTKAAREKSSANIRTKKHGRCVSYPLTTARHLGGSAGLDIPREGRAGV